jgi:hypothetical protein
LNAPANPAGGEPSADESSPIGLAIPGGLPALLAQRPLVDRGVAPSAGARSANATRSTSSGRIPTPPVAALGRRPAGPRAPPPALPVRPPLE